MTPHISAKKCEISRIVLLSGDPLRAKYIAENYLDSYRLVSFVRNNYFYTGLFNGKEITVGSSGMGHGSMAIYAYELFHFYDVEKIIRIGSCGSYREELRVGEIVLVNKSYCDSSELGINLLGKDSKIYESNVELNKELIESANRLNRRLHIGNAHSTNVFYDIKSKEELIEKNKETICVEMESGALFACAIKTNRKASCLLTVSDSLFSKEELSIEEKEKGLKDMILIALNIL